MASELKHTVKPSGGDFDTLAGAIAHLASAHANLVTSDVYATIEIDGSWSSADTAAVDLSGITTDATRYLHIYATGSARHEGVWSTSKYNLDVSLNHAIQISGVTAHVRLDGLQISSTVSSGKPIYNNLSGSTDVRISNCIIRSHNSSGYYAPNGDLLATLWNCIIYDDATGAKGIYFYNSGSAQNKAYNCTIIGYATGVYKYGTTTLKNILFYNNAVDVENGPATDTYCATTNDNTKGLSAAGTGNRFSQTFTFAGVGDYHLDAADGGALGFGVDDPGAGLFSDDIDGDSRT